MTEQLPTALPTSSNPSSPAAHLPARPVVRVAEVPEIFRQEWNPSISLDLNTRQKQLDGDFYEVVLTVSVTVKNGEDTTAFIAEVQQAGIFLIKNLDPSSMSHTLGAFCPNILFPYAREALDNLVVRGSFPALMLSPVNFDALYAQEIARMQASGEIPTPSVQ